MTPEESIKFFKGEDRRRQIAQEYSIVLLARYMNLSDIPVEGVFTKDLKEVHIIELTHKQNTNDKHSHKVGYTVANDLLRFSSQKNIPLFDPFTYRSSNHLSSHSSLITERMRRRTPLNEELFVALNIFFAVYGNTRPDSLFAKLLREVSVNFPEYDVKIDKIRKFNTALKKYDQTLYEIIAGCKARFPGFRDFSFPLMEKMLGPDNAIGKPIPAILKE